jgi:hypothetical protein
MTTPWSKEDAMQNLGSVGLKLRICIKGTHTDFAFYIKDKALNYVFQCNAMF